MSNFNPYSIYDTALVLREMGLCPIPLYRRNDPKDPSGNKRPMIRSWQTVNMPDDATLERWFYDDRRNLGIICGRVSGGLIVVDFDDMTAFREWQEAVTPPVTLTVDTGGGVHMYYRVTGPLPGNRKLIGGDLRGQGGQVVAPPSVHMSGRHYEWRDIEDIASVNLSDLCLPYAINSLPASHAPVLVPSGRTIDGLVRTVATAKIGNRNSTLFWTACRLFDRGLPLIQVVALLLPAALSAGLSERESRTTIESAHRQVRNV